MIKSEARLLCLLLLLSCLSLLLYPSLFDPKPGPPQPCPHTPQKNISILLWHWPFGQSYSLKGNKCLTAYNISHCFLTDDTDALPSADVVVFHHQELSRGASALPRHRSAWQRWVWMSLEPPVNNANLRQLNGVFNWTMSYRRDADIPVPYGVTVPGVQRLNVQAATNRSYFACWLVSKYRPSQARAGVYQSLKREIPIEVFGRWKKNPLPDHMLLPTISKCLFYLAFENSEARDYISEKLWRNAFQSGAIPVVLGPSRATYEAVAPPHSFIHVSDFRSTAELATYLKHVAADRQVYEGYLQWHHTHSIKTLTDWRERLCQICARYPSLPASKVYQDLEGWVHS